MEGNNENCDNLLNTIRISNNITKLVERLPKSNYLPIKS